MKNTLKASGILLAIVIIALPWARNPERQDLTPEAREAASGQFVQLADGVTHYEVAGPEQGPAVVLIHGFSVPSYLWDGVFTELASAGFRVLRYDLYGRGYSDRPNQPYDRALYDKQLRELLSAVGIRQPVDLVGISLGGVVAAGFAVDHPEQVGKVVLIDPFTRSNAIKPFLVPGLGDYLFYAIFLPMLPQMQMADFFDRARMPEGWQERYRQQMRYRGFGRSLLSTVRHVLRDDALPLYAELGKQKLPILLIWGEEDKTVPFADSRAVREALSAAEFAPISKAGHLPPIERPADVLPLLIEFLRE